MQQKERIRLDILDYSLARVSVPNKGILRPFTVFKVPGAHFSKLYKEKKWDGTVSLIKRNNLPIGLIPYLVKEAAKRDYGVDIYAGGQQIRPAELARDIFDPPEFDRSVVEQMLVSLPETIVPRYYQVDSFAKFLESSRGLIVLPTGAGKSLSIYMLAYMLRSVTNTGLIIVPRTDLVDQIAESIRIFSSLTVDVLSTTQYGKGVIGMLGPSQNIIVTTWQSWTRWMKSGDAVPPDFVIIDEAHTVAKKQMPWDFMKAFAATRYRFGLTATANERPYDWLTLQGLLGPVLYQENAEALIDQSFLATPFIHTIGIDHGDFVPTSAITTSTGKRSKTQTKDLVRRQERMKFVRNLVDSVLPDKKAILILTESVEDELVPLSQMLSETLPGVNVHTLTGSSPRDERKRVIAAIDDPDERSVLCVTYGLFQMGINIPSLGYILFNSPSRSHVRVLQSIGRGLRPKETCHVYDLVDYSDTKDDSMSAARKRIYHSAYGDKMKSDEKYVRI